MKVKCIEPNLLSLKENKVYEVIIENEDFYYMIDESGYENGFFKKRFEIVKEIKMPYKELLMDYCIKKNDLINKALVERNVYGLYYMAKGDFEEVKSWSEETCKEILEKLHTISPARLCPWCIKNTPGTSGCSDCNYGKRHGKCDRDDSSLYNIIYGHIGNIMGIKGMYELYHQTTDQYHILVNQEEKVPKKPEPISMENMEVYVVEFKHNDSGKIRKRICRYFLTENYEKYVLWLSNNMYCKVDPNDLAWQCGRITKIVANVTDMLYNKGIRYIEDEYGCKKGE